MTDVLREHVERLRHPDRNVRSRAALELGTLGDVCALDALVQALCAESNVFVREHITRALVCLGGAAVPPLIDRLRAEDPMVRHHAAHTLGKIGDARAVAGLLDRLSDDNLTVVIKSAFALGQIKDPRAIPALIPLLAHASRELQSTVVSVLEGFGAVAGPPLVAALGDGQWQVREQAAYVLGFIRAADAVAPLIARLKDPHWQVRFAAVHALADLGGREAREALAGMHDDADERVRRLAIDVMKRRSWIRTVP